MNLLFFVISYLIGNFTAAYILGKVLLNKDIRKMGSGNAGATNALRSFGPAIGVTTLMMDMLKGILALYLADKFGDQYSVYFAAVGVILGHNWPVFFGFKGGKGIATSAGVLIYLDIRIFALVIAIFIITVAVSKYVSLGSIIAAASAPICSFILNFKTKPYTFYVITLLALIAIYKHKTNIVRLINRTENKLKFKEK